MIRADALDTPLAMIRFSMRLLRCFEIGAKEEMRVLGRSCRCYYSLDHFAPRSIWRRRRAECHGRERCRRPLGDPANPEEEEKKEPEGSEEMQATRRRGNALHPVLDASASWVGLSMSSLLWVCSFAPIARLSPRNQRTRRFLEFLLFMPRVLEAGSWIPLSHGLSCSDCLSLTEERGASQKRGGERAVGAGTRRYPRNTFLSNTFRVSWMLPTFPYAFCVIAEVPESSVENYEPEVLEYGAKGTALATRLLPPYSSARSNRAISTILFDRIPALILSHPSSITLFPSSRAIYFNKSSLCYRPPINLCLGSFCLKLQQGSLCFFDDFPYRDEETNPLSGWPYFHCRRALQH